MKGLGAYFTARTRIMGLAALLALAAAGTRPSAPPKSLEGLAALLGRASRSTVLPAAVVWEPGRGVVAEALFGRHVLFLGSATPDAPRDVYRARVRLSAEGKPIAVAAIRNLTETPLGDDSGLEVRGGVAVFATTAFGRVQGVTVLDTAGVEPGDRPTSLIGRALLALTSFRRTGSFAGLGRTDLVMDTPPRSVKVELSPPHLTLTAAEPSATALLDTTITDNRAAGGDPVGLHVVRQTYRGRSELSWTVDLVRDAIGATPVAWLEQTVFGARDLVKRAGSAAFGRSKASQLRKGEPAPVARVLKPSEQLGADSGWPPPPIPSLWEAPKPGEGKWEPVTLPFLPRLDAVSGQAPPPYFQRTFIRPDPERPYSEVLLIAMDMRQLELGMEGGYEEPVPVVGPPGTGRIPRTPQVLPRAVAAFNGAFKAEHGAYGMMVGHRLLLPPVPKAATVLVTQSGEAGFGNWPDTKEIPGDIASFRQNLDPLLDGGVVNPRERHVWGWQVAGESSLTERTAICLTPAGHVYFAWGRDISGPGLARALAQAGCDYAVHLDMNPRHCGFVFMHPTLPDPKQGQFELADPGMSISPTRYVLGSDKDFFYVLLRTRESRGRADDEWTESDGAQPSPVWLPAIFETTKRLGDLEVRVVGFDPGRVDWLVRAGTEEPTVAGARSKKIGLEPELEGRAVAAIGLGHTTDALRYGLAFEGQPALELRRTYATLVLAPGAVPRILPPGERPTLGPGEDAVQLPLLANDGTVDERSTDRGGTRLRGALCVTADGRVLVASARHDSSDPIASVLVEAGCQRVVATDRGSRHPAFFHQARTAEPPLSHYETTVLYAVARPMTPHAFHWHN
jgi:hypothetical protein